MREAFDDILDNLVTNYWSEDGDWQDDMQGDSTAFAPMVLYPVGEETGNARFLEMATTTVDYEMGRVIEAGLTGQLSMDAVIGAPALAVGYEYTGSTTYRDLFLAGVDLGHQMMSENPEQFLPYVFDLATVYGTGGYMCFLAYQVSGDETFVDKGLQLITLADEQAWNESEGMYEWSLVADWPQATMIMALVAAHHATGQNSHLQRSLRIVESMEACCWDTERGGYFGHPDMQTKGLSGNNNMTWALIDLAQATGDMDHLQRATDVLGWILSEDLYSKEERITFHHWKTEDSDEPGRADSFCTGCNFHTLVNIHRCLAMIDPG